ncbi:hypothetical protein ABKN59_010645 [Abortiporus biennis]
MFVELWDSMNTALSMFLEYFNLTGGPVLSKFSKHRHSLVWARFKSSCINHPTSISYVALNMNGRLSVVDNIPIIITPSLEAI